MPCAVSSAIDGEMYSQPHGYSLNSVSLSLAGKSLACETTVSPNSAHSAPSGSVGGVCCLYSYRCFDQSNPSTNYVTSLLIMISLCLCRVSLPTTPVFVFAVSS